MLHLGEHRDGGVGALLEQTSDAIGEVSAHEH
jgi:hypothetical protein